MAERYFAGKDPIGETLSVATSDGGIFDFVVVGVYVYNQALFGKVDTSIPEKDRVTELMIPLQTCFKPVSYTHLDVYKRQVLYRVSRRIMQLQKR